MAPRDPRDNEPEYIHPSQHLSGGPRDINDAPRESQSAQEHATPQESSLDHDSTVGTQAAYPAYSPQAESTPDDSGQMRQVSDIEESSPSDPEAASPAATSAPHQEPSTPQPPTSSVPSMPQPLSTGAGAVGPEASRPKRKFGGKKLILVIVLAVLLAVLGGGAATYALWWNNPDKVTTDAMAQVLGAKGGTMKGRLSVKPKDGTDVTIDYLLKTDGKNMAIDTSVLADMGAVDINMSGSAVTHDGDLYLKVNDVKDTFTAFAGDDPGVQEMYGELINMIDGKWVVITQDDMRQYGGNEVSDTEQCVTKALETFRGDDVQQRQVREAYESNRFVIIKENLGTEEVEGRTSNHYVIGFDEAKAKSFATAMQQTDVYKAVDQCTDGELSKSDAGSEVYQDDEDTTTTYELWVDTWNHQPTKAKVTAVDSSEDIEVVMESTFNLSEVPTIAAPEAQTTVKDLERAVQKLQQSSFGYPTGSYDDYMDVSGTAPAYSGQMPTVQPRVLGDSTSSPLDNFSRLLFGR